MPGVERSPSPAPALTGPMRLLIDPPRDGATNMAVDEAMLEAVGLAAAPATLRLYRWDEPTLSLGYFQACADIADQAPAVRALPVVRRATGGGAIVHADELTYSLALPSDDGQGPAAGSHLYARMNAVLWAAVGRLAARREGVAPSVPDGPGESKANDRDGPFFCFARRSRFDLLAGTDKFAGSAQRRTRRGVLQHGSVILRRTFPLQPSACVDEIAGREVSFDELAEAIVASAGDEGADLQAGELTQRERALAVELRAKHVGAEWLRRR